ncbi:Plasminogen activator inhibitor 1 [Clonorchis sinensis]|uniref:Plasminogen activator inhibitor 1 n=1 Tax=Clonorchis sinensis TaxID=79923 RepID=A0A419PUH4_CLOSI|nr:Plasminogen activator inhibitor 1 [Clonorchis sinensis]
MSSNKSETRVQCFPLVWTHRSNYARTGGRPFKRECMYVALLMTLFGTGTDTRKELQDVLQLPRTLQDYEIMKAGSSLLNDISQSTDVTVLVANRLFLLNSVNFLSMSPKLRYNSGPWKHPFDKRHTRSGMFYTSDRRSISVQMMYVNQKFDYLEMDDIEADAIKLPFGDGSEWDMLIILPHRKQRLRRLLLRLQKKGELSSILSRTFHRTTLQLYMPRFRFGHSTSSVNMKQILINLGARLLFSDMADLSGMSYYDFLFVSDIFHKAVLEASYTCISHGATAAASTSVNVFSRSAGLEFRVDHPFFVAIVHRRAGPVFLGHVVRPDAI